MSQDITDRQAEILLFVRSFITEHGYPPTLREIGARMSIKSTNGVCDHLRALERKGYLFRNSMKSRGIVLTGDAPELLAVAERKQALELASKIRTDQAAFEQLLRDTLSGYTMIVVRRKDNQVVGDFPKELASRLRSALGTT